jgi:hypothetical protein
MHVAVTAAAVQGYIQEIDAVLLPYEVTQS